MAFVLLSHLKILTTLKLQNLDQTSATGLIWQNSANEGKERLRELCRSLVIRHMLIHHMFLAIFDPFFAIELHS